MSEFRPKKVFFFLTTCRNVESGFRFADTRYAKTKEKDWKFFPTTSGEFYREHLYEVLSELEERDFTELLSKRIKAQPDPNNYIKLEGAPFREIAEIKDKNKNKVVDNLFLSYDYSENGKLKQIVAGKYDEFQKSKAESWRAWEKIYFRENQETDSVYCALYDYTYGIYKKEFFDYIVKKLPELFPAAQYYLFIHGSSLFKDDGNDALLFYPGDEIIFEKKSTEDSKKRESTEDLVLKCPENLWVKTFHHQMCYDEYCFLIDPEMDDVLLELPFVNRDAKKTIYGLKKWLDELLLDPLNFEPSGNPLRTYLDMKDEEGVVGGFVAKYDADFAKNQIFKESNLCDLSDSDKVKEMKPHERLELAAEIYRRSHVLKLKLGWK